MRRKRKKNFSLVFVLQAVNIMTLAMTLLTGVRLFFLLFQYNILLVLENNLLTKQLFGLGAIMGISILCSRIVENTIRKHKAYSPE